jgi:CHAT domain-containing protein
MLLLWRLLLLLLLASLSASAESPQEACHRAIDRFDYAKARELAGKVPAGPGRELMLAEVDALSGRPDRSFQHTDALDPASLSPELLGKFHLVRAIQEAHSEYELLDERDRAVSRLIREGLRGAPSPHDRARLLLLKIERARPDQVAIAQEAAQEVAELSGVDPQLALLAQAEVAYLAGRDREALTLWRSLADTAASKGQSQAHSRMLLKILRAQNAPDQREQVFADARTLLGDALSRQDGTIAWEAWSLLSRLRGSQRDPEILALGQDTVAKLPDSAEKARALSAVASLLEGGEALEMGRRAIALAHQLGEPVMEAQLLMDQTRREPLRATGAVLRRQAIALLSPEALRGTQGLWFGGVAWLLKPTVLSSYSEITAESLEAEVDALGPSPNPKTLLEVYGNALTHALYFADAKLAEASFFQALEFAVQLPEPDRGAALERIRRPLDTQLQWANIVDFTDNPGWGGGLTRWLGFELAQRPALVEAVLDSQLAELRARPAQSAAAYSNLAAWLRLLGRPEEAAEMLEMASRASGAQNYDEALAALLIEQGDSAALDLLRRLPVDNTGTSAGKHEARLGWAALFLNQTSEAARYATLARAGEISMQLSAHVYELQALAMARQGQSAEALAVLDEGVRDQRARTTYSDVDSAYLLVRADVLAGAGRYREAAISLRGVKSWKLPAHYELAVRRRVAQRGEDQEALAAVIELERAFFSRPEALPENPRVADFLQRDRQSGGKAMPAREVTSQDGGFATLIEDLERLRHREPENIGLQRLSAADLKNLMAQSAADEIYVQPVLLRHSVVTIYVTRDKVGLVETFCDRLRLEQAMLALATGLSSPESSSAALESDRRYLAGRLVQPWRSRFPNKSRLRWIGDGPLQKLPLSALPDKAGAPLPASLAITFLDGPSCRSPKVDKTTETLLVGGASDLEGSATELEQIRKLFPRGQSWTLGGEVAQLRTMMPRHRLLHISTHGAPPTGTRQLGGRLMGDGQQLSAFDLSGLTLHEGSLAVLGSCDSGVDAGTGVDNSSLVSALRTAGAEMVVGSLWELDDRSAVALFASFYQTLLAGSTPDVALAQAQMAVRSHQSHPYYWAGMQVVSGP